MYIHCAVCRNISASGGWHILFLAAQFLFWLFLGRVLVQHPAFGAWLKPYKYVYRFSRKAIRKLDSDLQTSRPILITLRKCPFGGGLARLPFSGGSSSVHYRQSTMGPPFARYTLENHSSPLQENCLGPDVQSTTLDLGASVDLHSVPIICFLFSLKVKPPPVLPDPDRRPSGGGLTDSVP